jgi:hypothetical protein
MPVENESLINFYAEYHDLRIKTENYQLQDILGFITTRTQPNNKNHIYYKFIEIEDKYLETIKELKAEWQADVPCLQNFLMIDLNIKRSLSLKFLKEFTISE